MKASDNRDHCIDDHACELVMASLVMYSVCEFAATRRSDDRTASCDCDDTDGVVIWSNRV